VVTGGGTSGIVESGIDVAISVVSVDGKKDSASGGFGIPQSLSDGEWLTKWNRLRHAMYFNVDMFNGISDCGCGPGALNSVSS